MRVVTQRANHAQVKIDDEVVSKIKRGFLLLVGIGQDDNEKAIAKAAQKITEMCIFEDKEGKTDLSLADIKGQILSVSQFTLLADTKRGNRSSLINAMRPPKADELWQDFNQELKQLGFHVETGHSGADMKVELESGGPFTIVSDLD